MASFPIARTGFALVLIGLVSCAGTTPVLTTLTVTLPSVSVTQGQTQTATAAGLDQNGAAIAVGTVTWSSATPSVASVHANSGLVTALRPGTTAIIATSGSVTGQKTLTVTAPPGIKVNEVESSGGTPGDWAEFYNPTAAAVDLSGWVIKDNDEGHSYTFPAGTTIAAGNFLVADEASFGFGLGAPDAVRLYNPFGVLVDAHSWTADAAATFGRCPDGGGSFTGTLASTKGTPNSCAALAASPWPGTDDVRSVDGVGVFTSNLSGLTYEDAVSGSPAVLWGVRNGPSTLYRLVFSGGIWTPDPANGWVAGKQMRYSDGTGVPDAEGVTYSGTGSSGGIYVSTERNDAPPANTVSRLSVLRLDSSQAGASLAATNEWNLTADLPTVGANLGLEAIAYLPDGFLVAQGFYDEAAGHAYNPSEYANHGAGLFFVGLEANGVIYAYALNHLTNGFTRVATISSGFAAVMDLQFDRELNYLWAICDDTCGGQYATLEVNTTAASPSKGRFQVTRVYARPPSMPNLNNEAFAMATQSSCVAGFKPVFWADDGETGGHSIRQAALPCVRFP